jgi:hypothetical protein
LLDLAGVVDRARVERAVERAVRQRALDESALRATIEHNRGKKGCKLLNSEPALVAARIARRLSTRTG